MNSFNTLRSALMILATSIAIGNVNANPKDHVGECAKKEGTEKLRCERHTKMAEKCGPIKGEAHFVCDREFLLANPLNCQSLSGKFAESCEAERKAFKTCEANQGREFMKCVKQTTGESPMGH
jgi:hypothetical protein